MTRRNRQALLAPYQVEIENVIQILAPTDTATMKDAMRFLLHSGIWGTNRVHIAKVAGIPQGRAKEFERQCRKNHIWENGKVYADWYHEEHGGLALLADALVLLGIVQRQQGEATTPQKKVST